MSKKIASSVTKTISVATLQLLFSVMLCTVCYSQTNNFSSHAVLAEKIYLQLDNKVYTTDQTVWFKTIVSSASYHTPSSLSGVLYVELIDPNETVVEKKLVKLEHGIGDGFFQLTRNYTDGFYLVRAYTEWGKNFGPDFFFKEYIQLFGNGAKPTASTITNVSLIKSDDSNRRLTALLKPLVIDSIPSKEVTVIVSLDDTKDTLTIKRNGTGEFFLDYPITTQSRFATVKLQTKNNYQSLKTIALEDECLDLQFFAESGELVHGIPSLLGFKAVDCNGKGTFVEGEIIDSKGTIVTTFKSNDLGMGSVMLNNVDSTEKYNARIVASPQSGQQKTYALPAVAGKGNVLAVRKSGDKVLIEVSSNYLGNDSVVIRATCRGVIYYDVKGRLSNGFLKFSLSANSLPDGIINFKFMNMLMNPMAERLFFNEQLGSRLTISAATDKEKYLQREETKLNIDIKNSEDKPVLASVSVLVLNNSQAAQRLNERSNILSGLLLSSDLRGEIEKPGYYFEKAEHSGDLDVLMLTQGWSRYKYQKEANQITFQPEPVLAISGTVKGGFFQSKDKKGIDLTMMTFGQLPSVQAVTSDSAGRFSFPINDQFGEKLNVLIQSANKSGVKKDYTITLDKKETPTIAFNHHLSVQKPDSIIMAYVQKNIERKKAEDEYLVATQGVILQEVIVETYRMTPERKKVTDRFGKAKFVIPGKDIRDKEAKWSYGLYSVLLFNYPDKVNIVRWGNGDLYARLYNPETTLVVIDGIPVQPTAYPLIPSIPPSEVSSFEIIEYAKNFASLYCEVFPHGCANAPAWGNVIAIYTYGKKGLFGAKRSPGIVKAAVPAFAPSREFYAPKYKQLSATDWLKPDLRSLVYWQPKIITDSLGKATASFYNADNTGQMKVLVEAITEDGQIGYQQLVFDVQKREKKE